MQITHFENKNPRACLKQKHFPLLDRYFSRIFFNSRARSNLICTPISLCNKTLF